MRQGTTNLGPPGVRRLGGQGTGRCGAPVDDVAYRFARQGFQFPIGDTGRSDRTQVCPRVHRERVSPDEVSEDCLRLGIGFVQPADRERVGVGLVPRPGVHLAIMFYAIVGSDDPVTQLTDPDGKAPM